MSRKLEQLRNIGVIAHIDAGKTTTTEKMLFYCGAVHRAGRVDDGNTTTDDNYEEQNRGITIYSACVTFRWKDIAINLLDTPGHVDFTAEVERCLRVLDGAVVVFSAREGVEAQSETVWRQANHYHTPRVAFINKMDREGANFEAVFEQIGARLSANPVAIQIPLGEGPSHTANPFCGVIDLVKMKVLRFDRDDDGRTIYEEDIPEDRIEVAQLWREAMLDKLYSVSDELMELALSEQPIEEEMLHKVLREGTLHLQIQPVLCGSSLHHIGVQPLLDAVMHYLPSPADMPPVDGMGVGKKADQKEQRKPDPNEPFCGLVFKVIPLKTGDLSWIRVYSGELNSNTRAYNPRLDKKENIAQLWHIRATKKERQGQIDMVSTGDIVGVIGPRESNTGDTLCDAKHPLLLESIKFPETVISMAIEPESQTDRKKLSETLAMLKRQDPTLEVQEGETGQTLISGMGELHLEVVKNRLDHDFDLNVKYHKPQVSYRETIGKAVEVTGECHRIHAGKQLFAKVRIRMEPFKETTQPVTVLTACPPEELPPALLEATLDELRAAGQSGGAINSFPLMKLKVTLLGGETQEDASDEIAFRIAASDAFRRGLEQGDPVLLEPLMKLDITTPDEFLGNLVGDLQQRRAIIVRTENRGSFSVIEAHAPLAELFGYSGTMRSHSQGLAGYSMEPYSYAPAPPEVMKKYQM